MACKKIIELLQNFYNKLPKNTGLEGEIKTPNADHTLGNLIAHGIMNHQKSVFATYHVPHPLNEEIIIKFKLNGSNIKTIIGDVITYYSKIFNSISSQMK